jgi:hypothetical protein
MNADLSGVFSALKAAPSQGRVVMFISALPGEGVSPLVRQALREWPAHCAVDLDLRRNNLARSFVAEGAALGPPIRAGFNAPVLFEAVDPKRRVLPLERPIFAFHQVSGMKFSLGAFHPNNLPADAQVRVCETPHFWRATRELGIAMLVDAPSLARSKVGLVVAKHMDGVVLVVGDDEGAAPAAIAAKDMLTAAGAKLLGLVYAQSSAPARPLKRAS